MYQSKYRHENCSPNFVPVAKNPGSGSGLLYVYSFSFKYEHSITLIFIEFIVLMNLQVSQIATSSLTESEMLQAGRLEL